MFVRRRPLAVSFRFHHGSVAENLSYLVTENKSRNLIVNILSIRIMNYGRRMKRKTSKFRIVDELRSFSSLISIEPIATGASLKSVAHVVNFTI
jgi:hypothetical protein